MLRIFFTLLLIVSLNVFGQTPPATNRQPEPIHVDQAFQFSGTARDNQTVIAMWKIAPGYYLYRDRFHFTTKNPEKSRLGQPLFPVGAITKSSPNIGNYDVYEGELNIPIPVLKSNNKNLILIAKYQGCSEKGYCYPPTTKIVPINLAGNYMQPVKGISIDLAPTPIKPPTKTLNTQERIAKLLTGANLLALIFGFFGFGVLISLTPCVLPMVPILSSIIVGQKKLSHTHAFALSAAYVLGMAITYAIAGVIFGYIGGTVQAALQKPWIIATFSFVFVLLALSLFGFYQIQLPEKLRERMAIASKHQKHGSYFGAAMMGCISTLILSPCVTPPLVAVLGYISQSGNASFGGIALFSMGIGMGLPLLVIGAFGKKILPKAGPWMRAIENVLGIMLLAVAIFMLQRIIPGHVTMVLWALLSIGTAIYAGAFTTASNKVQQIFKGIGIILFIYGVILIIGATLGSTNPLQPININQIRNQQQSNSISFIPVKTLADVERHLADAKKQGKPVMLDFYADWCISCKEMDHFTFSNQTVKKRLAKFTRLRANVTANDIEDKMLERHYGVVAPPTIIFFDRNGKEIKNSRIIGEMSATKFLKHLSKLKTSK